MSKYSFGKSSIEKLSTAHADLQLIMKTALSRSQVDFGISEGHRSLERQKKLFDEGKSRIDGISKKGKHNHSPSLAVDVYAYVTDNKSMAYDRSHLSYLGGVITAVGEQLLEEGKVSHKIRWGGNWDSDGYLIYDHSFKDLPHFELI